MGVVLYKLSSESESYKEGQREYHFHCPGCNCMHGYYTHWSKDRAAASRTGAPVWSFNNNLEKPTFTPSLLYRWHNEYSGKDHVCHLYVTDGKIKFLDDCTHCLAGQIVDMKEIK